MNAVGEETVSYSDLGLAIPGSLARSWLPGEVLGKRYQIRDVIAKGGMGIVYKAEDLANAVPVAIKSILPSKAIRRETRERFAREAEAWVRLGIHPFIIRAFTVWDYQSFPNIVAEYAPGPTLDILWKKAPLPLVTLLKLGAQIAWGMAFAHDKGLIHRDLKSANILLDTGGRAKITDFGLARKYQNTLDAVQDSGEEKSGFVGTPEYMAPEQWLGKESVASDIYSFGIILFALSCGRRPWDRPNEEHIDRLAYYRNAHAKNSCPDPAEFRDDLPPELSAMILSCLEKDVAKRPISFTAIAETLNKISLACFGLAAEDSPNPVEMDRAEKLDQARGFLRLGADCQVRGEFSQAFDLYNASLPVFQELGDQQGLGVYYRAMGSIYLHQAKLEKAQEQYQKSLALAEDSGDIHAIGRTYNNLALVEFDRGHREPAKLLFEKSLEHLEKARDDIGVCGVLSNLGLLIKSAGKLDEAADLFQKSLALCERVGDQIGIAKAYLNIGTIYILKGEWAKALPELEKSLAMSKNLADTEGMSRAINNIGTVHKQFGDFAKALSYFERGFKLNEKYGLLLSQGRCCNNIGDVYRQMGNTEKSIEYNTLSLNIRREIGDLAGVSSSLGNLGNLYYDQGDLRRAKSFFVEGLAIAKEVNESLQINRLTAHLGRTEYHLGNLDEGRRLLREAWSLMGQGKSALAETMRAWMKELGETF